MPETDPAPLQDIRRALLDRSGLLDAGPCPEFDRWTAVLRRATGSAVAALAVPLGDRTLIRSLWIGDADQPEGTELPPGSSLEQFLSGRIGVPAWAGGLHSYLEDSVVLDLLDRESNTLHPGAGPSLPPHYLSAIDVW